MSVGFSTKRSSHVRHACAVFLQEKQTNKQIKGLQVSIDPLPVMPGNFTGIFLSTV